MRAGSITVKDAPHHVVMPDFVHTDFSRPIPYMPPTRAPCVYMCWPTANATLANRFDWQCREGGQIWGHLRHTHQRLDHRLRTGLAGRQDVLLAVVARSVATSL